MTKKSAHQIMVHQNFFHRQVCTNILGCHERKKTDDMKEKLKPLVEKYR